jgi:FlaA1/EpsC-like NDP-sugar epimerase
MPAFYVSDLAHIIAMKYGNARTEIENIGLMPGERIVEWLITNEEALRSVCAKHFYIIYPLIKIKNSNYPVINKAERLENGYCMLDDDERNISLLSDMLATAGY